MKHMIPFACLLALGGCGTTDAVLTPVSPADVAALEQALTVAETLALNYTRLPPCPSPAPVCAIVSTKQAIKTDAQRAYEAVKTLQASSSANAPAALSAARAAVAALATAIPVVPADASIGRPSRGIPIAN